MNAPSHIHTSQFDKLVALADAAVSAFQPAMRGDLFVSPEGKALVNAAFDIFECDQLYRLGEDVEHEIRRGRAA